MGQVCVVCRMHGEGREEVLASPALCGTSTGRKPGGSTGHSHAAGNRGIRVRMGGGVGRRKNISTPSTYYRVRLNRLIHCNTTLMHNFLIAISGKLLRNFFS